MLFSCVVEWLVTENWQLILNNVCIVIFFCFVVLVGFAERQVKGKFTPGISWMYTDHRTCSSFGWGWKTYVSRKKIPQLTLITYLYLLTLTSSIKSNIFFRIMEFDTRHSKGLPEKRRRHAIQTGTREVLW